VKTLRVTGRSACKGRTPFYRIAAQPCIRSVSRRRSMLLYFEIQCRILHFQTITWNLTETKQRNCMNLKDYLYFNTFPFSAYNTLIYLLKLSLQSDIRQIIIEYSSISLYSLSYSILSYRYLIFKYNQIRAGRYTYNNTFSFSRYCLSESEYRRTERIVEIDIA